MLFEYLSLLWQALCQELQELDLDALVHVDVVVSQSQVGWKRVEVHVLFGCFGCLIEFDSELVSDVPANETNVIM